MIVLLAVVLLSALMIAAAFAARLNYLRLPELPSSTEAGLPDHVVIIPARDEAGQIARVVSSFPRSEVVVVDDHSSDATAEIAASAGAHVRKAEPLQPGWKGKPNACWTGVLYTSSDWILFVDADTWYDSGFLPSLLAYAEREGLAALTVFPRQHRITFFERVLLPYVFGLYFAGVNAARVNDPRNLDALANGQCLLVKRDAYEFVQGHRAVAGSTTEDVEMARLFKRHRMKIQVVRAEGLAHARMYDSLSAIWRGFEKNSFKFLKLNRRTGLFVVAAATLMTTWLPVLLLLGYQGEAAASAILFFVPAIAWRPWYGSFRSSLLAPLAICLFQLIAISAMVKDLFGVTTQWKGRPV